MVSETVYRSSTLKKQLKVFAYGFFTGLGLYSLVFLVDAVHLRDEKMIQHYSQCAAYNEAINELSEKLSYVANLPSDQRDKLFSEYHRLMQLYTSNCDITSIGD